VLAADHIALRVSGAQRLIGIAADALIAAREKPQRRGEVGKLIGKNREARFGAGQKRQTPRQGKNMTGFADELKQAGCGAQGLMRAAQIEGIAEPAVGANQVVEATVGKPDARKNISRGRVLAADGEFFALKFHVNRTLSPGSEAVRSGKLHRNDPAVIGADLLLLQVDLRGGECPNISVARQNIARRDSLQSLRDIQARIQFVSPVKHVEIAVVQGESCSCIRSVSDARLQADVRRGC